MAGLTVRWASAPADAPTFSWSPRERLLVHRLALSQIDNDIGDRIAAELVRPGLVDDFEAAFAGVVESVEADRLRAWERFYAQTLAGLRDERRPGSGAIATFGAIYRHALSLVVGKTLLDAGSCFGFFCLLAAERGLEVCGTDVSAPTVALARRVVGSATTYRTSHRPPRFAVADIRSGLPGHADTVTALHVLEHLGPEEVAAALARLCAAARRRVIVAVPLETVPDPTYGHHVAFADVEALRAVAGAVPAGWRAGVHEHRGGWLVLDRA